MDDYYYFAPDENGFKDHMLDHLLCAGYYRMQHFMFTCNHTSLQADAEIIAVFWLRTLVQQCRLNKSAKAILKKCAGFTVTVQPAYVDDEVEALYRLYKDHVTFSVSSSCNNYLHNEFLPQPFHSMMIQVRDHGKLVAVGYFDKGEQSIAGIMNIYDPYYKDFSPGKLLILKKLNYAIQNGQLYYYTGYISPASTRFDYKTFPDPTAIEVFLPDKQQWVSYQLFDKAFLAEYYSKKQV
jgi:arginyl-tRNA--protein-N-Asp/Glu arginylyltransferase